MKILLSAFEPFGGEKVNASQEALKLIVPRDGMELIKITVPTVFGLAGETLLEAVCKCSCTVRKQATENKR